MSLTAAVVIFQQLSQVFIVSDKIISSVSALILRGAVAVIGYTETMPQPGETCTPQILWLTMFITFGLPILGWICTLIAMKFCKLGKEEMIAVQKRIENKRRMQQRQKGIRKYEKYRII